MLSTFFSHDRATVPEIWDGTWEEFLDRIGKHRVVQNKSSVELFCPAEFDPPRRLAKNVRRVHYATIDLDHVSEDAISDVIDRLLGIEFLIYSTHRHVEEVSSSGDWRCRIVIPITRPVDKIEWISFWLRLNAFIGYRADPKCKNLDRMYYVPSTPPGTEDEAIWERCPGTLLDVDELLGEELPSHPESEEREPTESVDKSDVKVHAQALVRRKSHAKWGRMLLKVVKGEPFAEPGHRDNTINTLIRFYLIPFFPDAIPEQLAEVFRSSIDAMVEIDETCPTMDVIVDKIHRSRREYFAEQAESKKQEELEKHRAIRLTFSRLKMDREDPYSFDELDEFASDSDLSRNDFLHTLVVQKGSSFYGWLHGQYYGPFNEREARPALLSLLTPLSANSDLGVSFYTPGQQGPKPMNLSEMVQHYGLVVDEVIADMRAQKTVLDLPNYRLIEAVCPLRELEPEYSENVNSWLKLLAHDKYEKLLDWIAVVLDQDRPCAAIYLQGPKGTGKSLLAQGLSRLWTTVGPTPLEAAMGSFNDLMSSCPLVFADEVLPKSFQGEARTGEIRRFIQERERRYCRKFIPDAKLVGCVRLVMAANNKDLLLTTEELSDNDIDAITERILYIPVNFEARKFLNELGTDATDRMVLGDEIAKHALWLSKNREVKTSGRFLIEGENSELHRSLATGSGLRAAVCHWLVSYLLEPNKFDGMGSRSIRRGEEFLVSAKALGDNWELYRTHVKTPQQSRISKALAGLSKGRRRVHHPEGNLRIINSDLLLTYAEDNDLCTREQLLEALGRPQLYPVQEKGKIIEMEDGAE